MKSIAFFYWEHEDGVTQKFYEMMSNSLQKFGYNVIPMCPSAADFDSQCTRLACSAQLDFCIGLTPQSVNISVNGTPIWKYLDYPFFIYILDTPIYHLVSASMQELLLEKNRKIVFGYPDANQMKIMSKACKLHKIKHESLFIPFAAPRNPNKINTWGNRDIEISVFGNVGKEISAHNLESSAHDTLKKYSNTDIPITRWVECIHNYINSSLPMNVTDSLLHQSGVEINKIFDPIWCSALTDADSFIKRFRRIQIVKSLKGKKINTYGTGWDNYDNEISNMVHHGKTPYQKQFEIFNRSKISVNIDPNWDFGVHDRVFNAASVGAISLTQRNPYIESILPDGVGCLCYAPNGSDIADAINDNTSLLEEISYEGHRRTQLFHNWDYRTAEIIAYMTNSQPR